MSFSTLVKTNVDSSREIFESDIDANTFLTVLEVKLLDSTI